MSFLKAQGASVVNTQGQEVTLKGVNFGGWLMMEGYFTHAPNTAQQVFEKAFACQCGAQALEELLRCFRANFIVEDDVKRVAGWGMNCIRLPFHYKVAEDEDAIRYLDAAIAWAEKYQVYVILDLHAAYGAQNTDWHSDSLGKANLWTVKANRSKTCALWEKLADRYKNESHIAGYDLLNEAVLDDTGLLNEFYKEAIKAVRQSDKNHMLFIEGNRWAQEISVLDDFPDDNWVYSVHFYEPTEFTFNFVPFLKYPLKCKAGVWGKDAMRRRLEGYHRLARKKNRPVHVGEFGVSGRQGLYNEHGYVHDAARCFNDCGFHWNYWTYKAVKHFMFPDGVYSYYPNPPWVNRAGPMSGWNRWKDLWPTHKKQMTASWRTKEFGLNENIIKVLRGAIQ